MNPIPIMAKHAKKVSPYNFKDIDVAQIINFNDEIKHRDTHPDRYTLMLKPLPTIIVRKNPIASPLMSDRLPQLTKLPVIVDNKTSVVNHKAMEGLNAVNSSRMDCLPHIKIYSRLGTRQHGEHYYGEQWQQSDNIGE